MPSETAARVSPAGVYGTPLWYNHAPTLRASLSGTFLLQTQLGWPWYVFRWNSALLTFEPVTWWICLKNNQQCICQVLWTWSNSHTLRYENLYILSLADHHELASSHLVLLWHCHWRLSSPHAVKRLLKKPSLTWQKSFQKLPSRF